MIEETPSMDGAASLYAVKPFAASAPRDDAAPPSATIRSAGRIEDLTAWTGVMVIIAGLFVFFFIASERLAPPLLSARGDDYELALAALYMLNVRSNAAFLVGSFIAMTGALLVLKGARARVSGGLEHTPQLRASLATDSPGLFLGVMGAVIIIVTLFRGASLEMSPRAAVGPPSAAAAAPEDELKKYAPFARETGDRP